MKRVKVRVFNRIAAVVLAVMAVFSVIGCSVEKTVTITEPNDKVMSYMEEENIDFEEIRAEEPNVFENVPLLIANETGFDIAELKVKLSSSDEWSCNQLYGGMYLEKNETVCGIDITYDDEDRTMDILAADPSGNSIIFDGIKLPIENNSEVKISLEYDKADGSYHAYTLN